MKAYRVRTKITLWAGLCWLVLGTVIISHATISVRATAVSGAEKRLRALGREKAALVGAELDSARSHVHGLAQILGQVRNNIAPLVLDRDQVNKMQQSILGQNDAYVGVFTCWEPNAFDNDDEGYEDEIGHDETGRFIPYWYRNASGGVEVRALKGYLEEETSDFYRIPRASLNQSVLPPRRVTSEGQRFLVVPVVAPVLYEENFYGVVGLDLNLSAIQKIAEESNKEEGGGRIVVVSDTDIVIGSSHGVEDLGSIADQVLENYKLHDANRLLAGSFMAPTEKFASFYAPVNLPGSGRWWINVSLPWEVVTAEARVLSIQLVLTGGICMVLAIGMLWFSVSRITRPIGALTGVVRNIHEGDLTAKADITTADEIGELGDSFNSMTGRLRALLGNLEEEVKVRRKAEGQLRKRSDEIKSANERLEGQAGQLQTQQLELETLNQDLENRVIERTLELEETHKELLEVSHRAGMSEVATGILHNVGNVLNGVNVSVQLIDEQLKSSKVKELDMAGQLIEKNMDNLSDFVRDDPKGKHLGKFVVEIGRHLVGEQGNLIDKMDKLKSSVDHMKEIVAMQQSYARVAGVAVSAESHELMNDALNLSSTAIETDKFEMRMAYDESVNLSIDKNKVLEILVNLITNAAASVAERHPDGSGVVVLRIANTENNRVQFQVQDNGLGIEAEKMDELFCDGYTTRKEGHGFGLHASALSANQLGGALTPYSGGVNQGAIFTLELPAQSRSKAPTE